MSRMTMCGKQLNSFIMKILAVCETVAHIGAHVLVIII